MEPLTTGGTPCVDSDLVESASYLLARLRAASLSVVTAESCTGGLISALLSQAEGAGQVLHGGFVVYSKDQKVEALNVDATLLREAGAVNRATVEQMLAGALAHSPAALGLAVTGVLGPDPDEDGNPVGLVYLAAGRRGSEPRIERREYGCQPHDILRRRVVLDALAILDRLCG